MIKQTNGFKKKFNQGYINEYNRKPMLIGREMTDERDYSFEIYGLKISQLKM